MRKQDERILDVMGRLEVVQTRMMTAAVSAPAPHPASKSPSTLEVRRDISESRPLAQQPMQRPAPSQSQESHEPLQSQPTLRVIEPDLPLDETQLAALNLLSESSKNTRQLTDALERSREHTARVMKELFEMGLVKRNDSTKPFVYQLTDEGRRRLSSGGSASPPSP